MTTLALLSTAVAGGTLLTWLVHPAWPLGVRLAAGTALGVTIQGLAGLAGAYVFGFERGALPCAWAAACASLVLLAWRPLRNRVGASLAASWRCLTTRAEWSRERRRDAAAWVLGTIALLAVFDRALLVMPAGLGTGVEHNLGDLPFHLAVASGFAWGANIPPQHPELAGVRLTYPYLGDFVAALWVRSGSPLPRAFRMQPVLLAPALVVLLWQWGLALTRDRRAARLVPLLVLMSGGLGFLWFAADLRAADAGLLDVMLHLPRDYTILPRGPLRWGNSVLTLLIPQRGFLLALPLVLIVWSLWAEALTLTTTEAASPQGDGPLLLGSGFVAGLLPLVHGHSFAAVTALGAALAVLFPRRAWRAFFAASLLLGVPQALLLAHGSALRASAFVGFQVGWDRGTLNPLVFWLLNTGAFLPLLAPALALAAPRLRRFHAPFALLFVVPNLLRLSPWIWDNVKFLFLWFVGAAPLVAGLVARLASGRWPRQLVATAAVLVLTLSGALGLWRVGSRQVALPLFDADGLAFARRVAEVTPPRARLLNWPTHDAPTLLSGRPAVLGYPGHIWSQGLDAGRRELDVAAFYAGAPGADEVLRRYGVDFVVVGPQERPHCAAGVETALARLPLAAAVGPYRLYDVRRR